jgi:hypothetical protein
VYKVLVPTLCNQPVRVVWRYLWVILIAGKKLKIDHADRYLEKRLE